MYEDFENTVDIEKEFPSIINTSNEPIFSKVGKNLYPTV